jgi:hypothetical protein
MKPLETTFWKNEIDFESEYSEDSASLYETKIENRGEVLAKMWNVTSFALF